MHDIPYQRYAGSVTALGAYGAPSILAGIRLTRTMAVFLTLLGLVAVLYAAGALDGAGGLVLLAGPTLAVDKREEALAKLLEAREMAEEDGTIPAEKQEAFEAVMAEFYDLDQQAAKAATNDEHMSRIEERFGWYTGQATGTPMRFTRTTLDGASRSPGQQFIESEAYKKLLASGALDSPNSKFDTGRVVVGRTGAFDIQAAATDVVQTESGGPGNALITPFRLPGAIPLAQRPLTIRDLFPNENMTSGDTIEYAQQSGFDNAAAAVAQATTTGNGAKPQSSIAWTEATAPARWIATWMAATRQALSDATQLRSLIDNQGRLMIQLEEEDQLVNGDGNAPNISGILDQSGLQLLDLSAFNDLANLEGVRTARRLVRTGTSRLRPTFVLVNPVDSEEYDLMKDLEGRYRASDPFSNIVGAEDSPPIWRLRRVETEALTAGTVIVGAREAATIYDRQPLTVLTADQHSDFFIRNLIVILFEERLAFPVYFPTGFVKITLDDWTAAS